MIRTNEYGYRKLGASGIEVSPLGIGTNRWGSDQGSNRETIYKTFDAYLEAGLNFFDTAEVYTGTYSERVLGECLRRNRQNVVIATKFAPLPNRLSSHTLMDALDASLQRLGLETIDLYMVHWPFTLLNIEALMDEMALAVHRGKVRAVGVSNFNVDQMCRAHARLSHYEIPLAVNEVHYSLVHRQPEDNGVLEACQELDVALIAYRPLESGSIARAGDLEVRNSTVAPTLLRQGRRLISSLQYPKNQEHLVTLRSTVDEVARAHGKTHSQVALNWLLQRDEHIIPIPGTTSPEHVTENAETLTWKLTPDEFAVINAASTPWK